MAPSPEPGRKSSSMSAQVRHSTSRSTISAGLNPACLRVAETRVLAIEAFSGVEVRSASWRVSCSHVNGGIGRSGSGPSGQFAWKSRISSRRRSAVMIATRWLAWSVDPVSSLKVVRLRVAENRRETGRRGYPDRVGSRRGGDSARMGRQQAGRLVPVGDAEALARAVEMRVDGVLGDAQFTGDLLGTQVCIDETQTLAFALGE